MSAPKPNAELAYRVLDHIDAHPDGWRQDRWRCGSAYCFGGWAVHLSGGDIEDERGSTPDVVIGGPPRLVGMDAEWAACTVLGIGSGWIRRDDQMDEWLFSAENTRADLGRLVEEIFGPRPGGAS